jgi:hypothetical protein
MNKSINTIPLLTLEILGYYSLIKAHLVALLPENKSVVNSDMPENLSAVGYVKK